MRRVLERLRPAASRFCCDCGEAVGEATRARWGGPRCAGCRALARPRGGLVAALALAAAFGTGFWLGRVPPTPLPPSPPPAPAPARAVPPPPAPEPPRACGARTKRGTRCKRLVHGEGP